MCASPSAPPPSSATPIFGRAFIGGACACCGVSAPVSCADTQAGKAHHANAMAIAKRIRVMFSHLIFRMCNSDVVGTQKVYCAHTVRRELIQRGALFS